jgi:hypothetical protein
MSKRPKSRKAKKYADIRITFTIAFEDDGELQLEDQAIEQAMLQVDLPEGVAEFELIGKVRDADAP